MSWSLGFQPFRRPAARFHVFTRSCRLKSPGSGIKTTRPACNPRRQKHQMKHNSECLNSPLSRMQDRIEFVCHEVGVVKWIYKKYLIRVETKPEDVLQHQFRFVFTKVKCSKGGTRGWQCYPLVRIDGPQFCNMPIELSNLGVGHSLLYFVPIALKTENLAHPI